MRFSRYINEVKITFRDENIGYHSGQSDNRLIAHIDGEVVGHIDYVDYQGDISISMIDVSPKYQSKGVGKELVLKLQSTYPKKEIDWGMVTGPGMKLYNSVKSKLYVDREKRDHIKKLKSKLESNKKQYAKIMKELEKGDYKNADKLNDLDDENYEIEEELWRLR